MRIVIFGKSRRRTRTTRFIVNAFRRAGHKVLWIRLNRWKRFLGRPVGLRIMRRRIASFGPEYAFLISKDCPTELVCELSARATVSVFCALYREEPDAGVVERAKLADILFLTNDGQRQMYLDAGAKRVVYISQACDDRGHRRASHAGPKYQSDVAFIGRPDEERVRFISRMAEKFHVKVWGPDWDKTGMKSRIKNVTPRTFSKICAGASVMLGADRTNDVRLYFSNRTWITLGCGGFLLTNYIPGLEELFENRKHLVWYKSEDECMELIDYYLKHPDECRAIADEGYRYAHENHTYGHFARRVLTEIEKIRGLSS